MDSFHCPNIQRYKRVRSDSLSSLLFTASPTIQEQRVKADYWDVWSSLFATHFFKLQADWCAANGVAHITHLNKEHEMPACVKAEGDYFRALSKVQIPGVDAIWNQIWPSTLNDFPKLASSVAHVYGNLEHSAKVLQLTTSLLPFPKPNLL